VYNPAADRVYVTLGLIDELWVYDPDTWERLERVPTGQQDPVDPGYGGHGLAALGRCVFVSNYLGESVTAVIEGNCSEAPAATPLPGSDLPYRIYLPLVARNQASTLTISGLGGRPEGMAAAGSFLFVTLPDQNEVVVINTRTLSIIGRLPVQGDHPHTVVLSRGR